MNKNISVPAHSDTDTISAFTTVAEVHWPDHIVVGTFGSLGAIDHSYYNVEEDPSHQGEGDEGQRLWRFCNKTIHSTKNIQTPKISKVVHLGSNVYTVHRDLRW